MPASALHTDPTPTPTQPGADPWQALAQARTVDALCQAWLSVLAQSLLPVRAALLLLQQPDGSYAPSAALPPARDLSFLADIATDALRQREATVRHDALGHARVAVPLASAQALHGAVVLDLGPADEALIEQALRLTQWGAGWLLDLLNQRQLAGLQRQAHQGTQLLDILLAVQAEASLREAALALVNRLARDLSCTQVQIALARRQTLKPLAMSHAAWFEERAEQVQLALQAMHEAYDQRQRIDWPADADDAASASRHDAHRRYAQAQRETALCSLPLSTSRQVLGVLMLERETAFMPEERALLDALALAPLLELKRDAERGLVPLAAQRLRRGLARVADGTHLALKAGVLLVLLLLVLLALLPAPFRVTAQALVEGEVQRAAVAPFEGYLRSAPARAGDTVRAGQVLAVLDDKDLQLEKVRWESELELALRKEREAMAKANRVDQRLAAAQANQARAQLDLVLSRLARVQVVAPFDAVVVKGDLSQLLGTPLEQGKLLFELAPLDSWRVVLKVDERDIAHVVEGARGELVLAALAGQRWPFTVSKITPVSVAEEGRNHFRVEARLEGAAPKLSPNMEGVAKVDVGQRSLLWVWTHPLVDWLRLAWFRWLP